MPVPADDVAALATGSETIIAPVPASTPATEYRAPVAWKPVIDGISSDHLAQGRALLESGYVDEAIAELSIAAGIGSNLLEANDLLGRAYSRRGWHKQAMECYERALVAVPNDPLMLAGLGYSLYLNNNQPLALKRLKQAAKRLPNDPSIQNNIGLVQTRLGKFDDAYKSFARAGGEFNARVRVAQILESVGRDKEAVKHFEAALRLQPNAPIALQRLAILYQRTNRRDEAEAVRRTLAKPAEKNAAVTGGGS
ncbi:MAG: tetratricopeptide repeat protein [Pyrinomonadaceae bacterium]|nr:tetratricopeptide repeat protein [Pyrinomonadaceae bacterium]